MKKILLAVAFALVNMAVLAQNLKANMDGSVKPGDNFWQYAVGNSTARPSQSARCRQPLFEPYSTMVKQNNNNG